MLKLTPKPVPEYIKQYHPCQVYRSPLLACATTARTVFARVSKAHAGHYPLDPKFKPKANRLNVRTRTIEVNPN